MPRTARKNKRESLLEEKRKLLDKLNAVDLQIKAANKEAKEKWDDAFIKGITKIPQKELGEEYYSTYPVDDILECIREAIGEMKKKEENADSPAPEGAAAIPDPDESINAEGSEAGYEGTPAQEETVPSAHWGQEEESHNHNEENDQAAGGNLYY